LFGHTMRTPPSKYQPHHELSPNEMEPEVQK
jgi:hypothetical protein